MIDTNLTPNQTSSTVRQMLHADAFLASSLLQKAIRRGDRNLAEIAAIALYKLRGVRTWRRLVVVAFEDVGIGSADALIEVVRLANARERRLRFDDETCALSHATRLLAAAAKDRSADYLLAVAAHDPASECHRESVGRADTASRLSFVADQERPLTKRAIATWFLGGLDAGDEKRLGPGDPGGLASAFHKLGVPDELAWATFRAATMTREPIVLMIPLLWLEWNRRGSSHELAHPSLGAENYNGLPLYALDKHTRLGRAAIDRFASTVSGVREALLDAVPPYRSRDAARMAAFYLDAVPTSPSLVWSLSDELKLAGKLADMAKVGVAPDAAARIEEVFRGHRGELDQVRAQVLADKFGGQL